jgi:allophanate hydrolase subunit 1
MKMFDPALAGLCPVAAGDRVRFVPIARAEFLAAGGVLS